MKEHRFLISLLSLLAFWITPAVSGQESDQRSALGEAWINAQHAIRPSEESSERWEARNPGNDLQIQFSPGGMIMQVGPLGGRGAAGRFETRWQATGLGFSDEINEIGAGEVSTFETGSPRIEIRRPGLVEWFVNRPSGLEHGFTLSERPRGGNPGDWLRVELEIRGDLVPELSGSRENLVLRDSSGTEVLRYSKLKVWDANGGILPARMAVAGKVVALEVDDTAAVYPVVIDPEFSQKAYLKANNGGSFDFFGNSVAISGDTAVIGAPRESSDSTGVNGSGTNDDAYQSGAAYVFVRDPVTRVWSQQAYLKASNTGREDGFGISVAIAGDTIVVGASEEDSDASGVDGDGDNDDAGFPAGAAYVFHRVGTTWTQQAYLKPSNTQTQSNGMLFGESVSVDGDSIIVGAPSEGDFRSGAAYIYRRDGSTWAFEAYLKAPNGEANDIFGKSVGISGDTVVVGASEEASMATGIDGAGGDNSAYQAGAAYVFVRNAGNSTWSSQAYLKGDDTTSGDQFGRSVAIDGDTVVVGMVFDDSDAIGINGDPANENRDGSGSVYVFHREGTTWSRQAYLKASNPDESDIFGWSVAIDGDRILVGAYFESSNAIGVNGDQTDNSKNQSGAAYAFERSGMTWSQTGYLKASNPDETDWFGSAVSVSGEILLVGAGSEDSNATTINGNQDNNTGFDFGAAYVFDLSDPPIVPPTATAPGSNPVGGSIAEKAKLNKQLKKLKKKYKKLRKKANKTSANKVKKKIKKLQKQLKAL